MKITSQNTSTVLDAVDASMEKVGDHIMRVTHPIEDRYQFDEKSWSYDYKGKHELDNVMTRLGALNWQLVKILHFMRQQPFAFDAQTREAVLSYLKACLPPHPIPESDDEETQQAAEALAYVQQRVGSWIRDLEGAS